MLIHIEIFNKQLNLNQTIFKIKINLIPVHKLQLTTNKNQNKIIKIIIFLICLKLKISQISYNSLI